MEIIINNQLFVEMGDCQCYQHLHDIFMHTYMYLCVLDERFWVWNWFRYMLYISTAILIIEENWTIIESARSLHIYIWSSKNLSARKLNSSQSVILVFHYNFLCIYEEQQQRISTLSDESAKSINVHLTSHERILTVVIIFP